MKKAIIALLSILVMLFMSSYAESIEELIPNEDLWGISQEEYLKLNDENNYSECKIGKKKALSLSNVTVGSFVMDAYYVFDAKMKTSAGRAYSGLSKVTYILTGNNTKEELQSCFETLVGDMTQTIGEPDTAKKSVSTWEYDGVKIQIGKGKFEKYTGTQDTSVAAVFTAIDIPYSSDIQTPTPKPSPTPTANLTLSPKPTSSTINNSTESAKNFELIPEVFVNLYDTSFSALLTTIGFNSSSADIITAFAEVSFASAKDGAVIYSNSNNTVALAFKADDKYSSAESVMMYTSLKEEENPLLNLPQFAFAALISLQTQPSDSERFLEWVNECADGKIFVGEAFYAICRHRDKDNITICVMLK